MKFKVLEAVKEDPQGKLSSKRIITFFAFALIVVCFFVDLFTDLQVSDYVYQGVVWIVVGGMGATSAEKFIKKPPRTIADHPEELDGI